jgi:hypothetical protein
VQILVGPWNLAGIASGLCVAALGWGLFGELQGGRMDFFGGRGLGVAARPLTTKTGLQVKSACSVQYVQPADRRIDL